MSTKADIFAGRKECFALSAKFGADPDQGHGATPDESPSWGSLEIWVQGKNLCGHIEDGKFFPSVNWYLLPLIEWFAANWDPLLHEERLPNRNAGDNALQSLEKTRFPPARFEKDEEQAWFGEWREWWLRHALRSCRNGGLFPDILIRRRRDMVEISWGDARLPGIPEDIVFSHSKGTASLDPVSVARPLYDFLKQATGRLVDGRPESDRLRRLKRSIGTIRTTTPNRTRLAWMAGMGRNPAAIKKKWDGIAEIIAHKGGSIAKRLMEAVEDELVIRGSCYAALMFGSAAPNLSEHDLETLAGKLVELYAPDSEEKRLRDLIPTEPVGFEGEPWEVGYDLAEQVMERLSLDRRDSESVDISMILDYLGIRREKIALDDRQVRGVSIAGPDHQPGILTNENDPHNETAPGERFTLAHELCHILFDRTYGKKLAMVSGAWAPLAVEKRANAFAAMLLMPTDLVRRVIRDLGVSLSSEQDVHEVRNRLGTSFKATLDHLKNLGWLDPGTAGRIEEEREMRLE